MELSSAILDTENFKNEVDSAFENCFGKLDSNHIQKKYSRDYIDVETISWHLPQECKFKIYSVEVYNEAGFSSSEKTVAYFDTKEKAIEFINSDEFKEKGQISICPIYVR